MTSIEVLQSVSYLLGRIEAREWETIRSFTLEPSPAHFRARTNVIAQTPECYGMTLLHAAVKCDPPPELVLDMVEICPDLLDSTSCSRWCDNSRELKYESIMYLIYTFINGGIKAANDNVME